MNKRYSEMVQLETFEERFDYLKLNGAVGKETFGFDRVFNQVFYKSREWQQIRDKVIIRDDACDLGIPGRPIAGRIYVHHMNPIGVDDIKLTTEYLLNPDYLICTSFNTHQAIHYGDKDLLILEPKERTRFDTCPWKN